MNEVFAPELYRRDARLKPVGVARGSGIVGYHHAIIGTSYPASSERVGGGVKVAFVDSGIDQGHQCFRDRVVASADYSGSDNTADDLNGHGTHVSGVAVGVASGIEVINAKALGQTNSGTWSGVQAAIDFAVASGADIINLSLGGFEAPSYIADTVEACEAAGVVVVAAAGNFGPSKLFYPAAYATVLSVAGTKQDDTVWEFSGRVGAHIYAPAVQVAGPARGTLNEYALFTGTSASCPQVTGACAILKSLRPNSTPGEIRARVRSLIEDVGVPRLFMGSLTTNKVWLPIFLN